ncbi:MAG: hypothetical protein JWL69_3527 [Phycisphaerales bacterium]|nr:hypothetical protein [Phycisphaerales bacterium]
MGERHFHGLIGLISFGFFFSGTAAAQTAIVGDDPNGPTTLITVNSGPLNSAPSFSVSANLIHNGAAGNLLKDFTNTSQGSGGTGSGISSGTPVPITETFRNSGADTWSGWSEKVFSQTDFGGPTGPDFLFDPGSFVVKRNGAALAPADYNLAGSSFTSFGNSGYSSFTMTFAPAAMIQPGDTLEIDKSIHEVFGDGDVWSLNEVARVAETPISVPEPTSLALLGLCVAGTLARHPRNIRKCDGRD